MSGPLLRQLSPRLYSIPRGNMALQFTDLSTGEILAPLQTLGDVTAEFDFQSQDTDIRFFEDPDRRIVASDTVQADGTVKGKFRQFGAVQLALA